MVKVLVQSTSPLVSCVTSLQGVCIEILNPDPSSSHTST